MDKLALSVNSNVKIAIVSGLFDAANGIFSFRSNVNVDFIPDLIVLKNYAATFGDDTDPTTFKVISNLVNGELLTLPFARIKYVNVGGTDYLIQEASISQQCDYHFLNKAKKMINGVYDFQITSFNDVEPNNASIVLSMVFEFIKF